VLKVRATLDYGSRPFVQLAIYPFKERSSGLHMQSHFFCSVPKFRMLFQNRIDLISEVRVPAAHLVFGHVCFPRFVL
jgi:hypothetical protein